MALQTTLYVKNISENDLSAPDDVQWSFLDIDGNEAMNIDGTLKPNHVINLYELNGRVVIAESTELKELIDDDKLAILNESMEVLDKTNSLYSVGLSTVSETENIAKDEVIEEEGIVWNSQNDVFKYSTEKLEGKEILVKANTYNVEYEIKDCLLVLEEATNITIKKLSNTEVLGRNNDTYLKCLDINASLVDVYTIDSLVVLSSNMSFNTLNFNGDKVIVKYSMIFGTTVNMNDQLQNPEIDSNNINVQKINHNNSSTTSPISLLKYEYKNTSIEAYEIKSFIRWQSTTKIVEFVFGSSVNVGVLNLMTYTKVKVFPSAKLNIGRWYVDQAKLYVNNYSKITIVNIWKSFDVFTSTGASRGLVSYSKYGFEAYEDKYTTKN